MSVQTPRSIEEMLTAFLKREYLMLAIQREFVWGADQIIKLVGSLSCADTSRVLTALGRQA
ncbi:hypothetical protein [Devriesea agamarum]|uniref:hypothetical protein n=1 Tax=Devriesea agamarum TaxID=472569 RepID=UPI00071D7C5E|nr:hypothetical protein [Devriesea agamarum]